MSTAVGIIVGPTAGGARGIPALSQLGDGNWSLREARVGDAGTSSVGPLTVVAVNDTSRLFVRIAAKPLDAAGEWGVAVANLQSQLDAGALGADASISASQITALAAGRTFLTLSSLPWAQVFYRPVAGSGAWKVASTRRQVAPALTGAAAALEAGDWTVEPFGVNGTTGVLVPRVGALAEASVMWWTQEADPVAQADNPGKWNLASIVIPEVGEDEDTDGLGYFVLSGLTGNAGDTLGNIRVVYRTPAAKVSAPSNALSLVLPGTPGAFTNAEATYTDATILTGDGRNLTIIRLPEHTGTPLRIEYQTSSDGVTWSTSTSLDPVAQVELIRGSSRVRVRLVTDAGTAAWYTIGPVSASPGSVDPAGVIIYPTPVTGVVVGQAVHFRVARSTYDALAAAAGISRDDYEATCEILWEFAVGNSAEDYPFAGLPADHMGGTTAGRALGPHSAHVYIGEGPHTVRATIYRLGAQVAQGTLSLAVGTRSYSTASQGYLANTLPVAGSDGVPAGVTNLFTSLDTAWAWVCAADGRALFSRRGQVFSGGAISGSQIRANMMVAAYDATGPHGSTGARPRWNIDFGYRTARITATGNGTQQVFEGQSLNTNIGVYFGNVRQVEGVGYTRDGNRITANPGDGVILRVFNLSSAGALRLGGTWGQTGGGRDGAIIRDIDPYGGFDPSNGGIFDPADLSTANRFAETTFLGGGSGNQNYITVFRCNINGFGTNIGSTNPGEMLAAVDCNLDDWGNYAMYTSNIARTITVGCSLVQDRLAQNGVGDLRQSKAFNTPGKLNAPLHGPIRVAYSFQQVLNRCRMDSRTSWSGNDPLRSQPITRLSQSTKPGQNYTFTECHTSGGQGCFSGGAANATVTANRLGMAYVGYNVFLDYPELPSFGNGQIYATSISNLYLMPAGNGAVGNFAFFRKQTDSPYIVANDVRTEAWRSINDTFLVLQNRPGNELDMNPSYVLASAGMQNLYSVVSAFTPGTPKNARPNRGGYVLRAEDITNGGATARIWINPQSLSAKGTFASRIWRGPTLAAATSAATVTAQRALYDWQYGSGALALALNDDADTRIRDMDWVDVTLKSGTWTAGVDLVAITREQCVETAGTLEIDEETGEETGNLETGTPETFFVNNRSTPLVRPPAQFFNSLILISGTWASVKRDDAVVSDLTPYRPATWGPFDAYWRPGTGNTAIGDTSGIRAAFDVRGQLRNQLSRGALEPDTDVTGWPAIPLVPSVSVALSPSSYAEGDTFGGDNVVVTINSAGVPAITLSDVTKTAEVLDASNTVIGNSSGGLDIGKGARGRINWAHQTVPRQETKTAIARVADPNFVPGWITANATLVSPFNGARVNASFLPPAAGAQHIAFRIRGNAALPSGAARLFVGDGTSPPFNLRMAATTNAINVNINNNNVATLASSLTGGETASILVSSYPGDRMEAQVKVGSGPVQTISIPGTPQNLFQTGFRIFQSTQGTPDVDFQQFVGLWTGGAPVWSDFFEPNGMVRDWRSNSGLNVDDMEAFVIIDGAGTSTPAETFNGRKDSGALDWLARTQPTTMQSSITYDGVTVTLAAARPVGFFADGSPFIVSSGAVTINSMSPASDSDGTYDRHGAMLNPDGASGVQGFDGGIGVAASAALIPYSGAANVDPGKTGSPLVIADGGAGTIVKSIRNAAWTAGNWITIDRYVPITVLSSAPPEGAFRPAYAGSTKPIVATLDMLDMGVFRSLAPYSGMIAAADAAARIPSIMPPYITTAQTEEGYRRMQTLREGASTGYSRDVCNWTHAGLMHLHASTATAAQKRAIAINAVQRGLDMLGLVTARGSSVTGAGAGQSHGWQAFGYVAAFALRKAGLLETAKIVRGNMTDQHLWNAPDNLPNNVIIWGGATRSLNRQVYFPEHIGQPEWRLGDVTSGAATLDVADSRPLADYRFTAGNPQLLETLATALLQAGPNGETGAAAIANRNFTSASRKAASIFYLDRWRTMTPLYNSGDVTNVPAYDAWRDQIADAPRWTGIPEQYQPGFLPSLTATDGGFSYDFAAGVTMSTLPITRYDLRYSLDGITWIEVLDCGVSGTITGLTRMLHYVQFRAVNAAGPALWSSNFLLDFGTTNGFAGTVTPTGTPSNSAPVFTVDPQLGWRPYHPWAAPYYEPAPAELPEGVPTLYAGRGYVTGHPAPTFTQQHKRNGSNILGATAQAYDIQGADAGSTLTATITATNSSNFDVETTAGALVAGTPPAAQFFPVQATQPLYLRKTGGLTGAVNNKLFTAAFRFRPTGPDGVGRTFVSTQTVNPRTFSLFLGTNNRLDFSLRNASNTEIMRWLSNTGETFLAANTNIRTVVFSVDLSDTGKRHFYIDGTATTATPLTYNNDTINWQLNSNFDVISFNGIFEYLYMTNEYLNLADAAIRNRFTSAADMGVDGSGATGTAPLIYISGDAAAWNAGLSNQGTGGAFGKIGAGSFTDA